MRTELQILYIKKIKSKIYSTGIHNTKIKLVLQAIIRKLIAQTKEWNKFKLCVSGGGINNIIFDNMEVSDLSCYDAFIFWMTLISKTYTELVLPFNGD